MLVLASGSLYRQKQLADIGLEFRACKPDIDESAEKKSWMKRHPGRLTLAKSKKLATYLASEKAKSVAMPGDVVIGSDQLVFFKGEILGKPGDEKTAYEQLKRMRGHKHTLVTAVALCYAKKRVISAVIEAEIKMARVSDELIIHTLKHDQPFDCAGAYKFESLGPLLIESVKVSDSTSILGLPVLTTLSLLRKIKYSFKMKEKDFV